MGKGFGLFRWNNTGDIYSTRGQQSSRESGMNGETPARRRMAGLDDFEFRTPDTASKSNL